MSVQDEIQMQRLQQSVDFDNQSIPEITELAVVEEIVTNNSEDPVVEPAVYSSPDNKENTIIDVRMAKSTQHPVKNFSLRGLKNLVFGSHTYSETNWSRQPLIEDEETGSRRCSGDLESDSESQTTLNNVREEKTGQSESFQFDKKQCIKDVTIGLADGLTVPFALTAGLSALGKNDVVVAGGLAELIAGAISMGLGGYMAEKSAVTFYRNERKQVQRLVVEEPQAARDEIHEILEPCGLPQSVILDTIKSLEESPLKMTEYIMRFSRCELEPDYRQATVTSITIGLAYFFGGLVPLLPYMCVSDVYHGLQTSVVVMIIALFIFGYVRACWVVGFSGQKNIRFGCTEGVWMVLVGSVAAGAAMGMVKLGDRFIQ